ncbi:ABC transporter [Scleroderma citrinum]
MDHLKDKVNDDRTTVSDNSLDPEKWWHRYLALPKPEDPPPRKSIHDAQMIPEASTGFFSLLTFNWVTQFLISGHARPLEAEDLYKLQDDRTSSHIANIILESFQRRCKEAQEYNSRLERGEIQPGLKALWWTICGNRAEHERAWREKDGRRRASLILAMNDSVKWFFWTGGLLRVISDTALVTSSLVIKRIITFASDSYTSHQTGQPPPSVWLGIGLCLVLLALQLISSWCMNHSIYRGAGSGVLLSGGLITAIYSRALKLTFRSRAIINNGRLVNHISTDVSRINFCMGYFHSVWASVIQLIICFVLLLVNLGPSAITGFAFYVVVTPINTYTAKRLFSFRLKSMKWTDLRSKSLQEIFGGMKVIKFFSWEMPFLKRISESRRLEMGYIRTLLILRAALNAVVQSLPALASVVVFITYALLGHPIDAATIFSSLTLLQLLRVPFIQLPTAISSVFDAATACERLYDVFDAEISDQTLIQNTNLGVAVKVEGASFSWDTPSAQARGNKKGKSDKDTPRPSSSALQKVDDAANIFQIKHLDMEIPRGKLVAIVGAVGVGKTSLLQGLIGEMQRTAGTVEFCGTVSYCAQSAWIQNATIRENICFGRPFEEERYWRAVRDACLEADLLILPNYDLTKVGERGITLSGGQKQRINICRAIYCDADIQIFDDPLSALDAHVGKEIFHNVFKNGTIGKTRILVTHALHFLPEVDYIYTMVDGQIAERGTYCDLIGHNYTFARLISEFGSKDDSSKQSEEDKEIRVEKSTQLDVAEGKTIMEEEERNMGTMGIYAVLGVSQAITQFTLGVVVSLLTYDASQKLHERAIYRVLHAPMSFFGTTPLGCIMNRFLKDISNIDNVMVDALRMTSTAVVQIFGAAVLISTVFPWFLIAIFVVLAAYFYVATFYQASARRLKRLEANLRDSVQSHFSETLSGLTTIRAYGEVARFENENHEFVDIENRPVTLACWLMVTNERWLNTHLDFLGSILTFAVALLTVGARFTMSPGQTGVLLSYILSVQSRFGWAILQFAGVEKSMHSVERIVHYAEEIEQEAPHYMDQVPIPADWPSEGRIVLNDVVMKYRPELPPVLKGLSMTVVPGEKIGIVGRTGAGKSSIMTALYRIVELSSGSIEIDDVDISDVGLSRLRKSISIIPQDAFLFSGTLRTNLDPFGVYDDACLWDALRRAHLVESSRELQPSQSEGVPPNGPWTPGTRFSLDSPIEEEGMNLSTGQRSLVSLARALVNDTKILVLDEATASVDYETDRKIQDTIVSEFKDRTILCIAHRLRTIISYDRICVLDAGTIAEFDTPANLFAIPNGIFRGMCETSSISLDDIMTGIYHAKQPINTYIEHIT